MASSRCSHVIELMARVISGSERGRGAFCRTCHMRPSVASSKVQSIKCDGSAGNRTPVFNVRTVQISSSFSSHHTTHYIINILTDSNRDTFLLPGLCLSPLTHNLSCEREIVLSGACYMLWTFRCVHTAALQRPLSSNRSLSLP